MHARIALGRTGTNKPRDFRRLARAALERERQEVLHWAGTSTVGLFPGVDARKQPRRRERG